MEGFDREMRGIVRIIGFIFATGALLFVVVAVAALLPVVASPAVVARKILFYSYVMVLATLALAPYAGWLYTAAAVGLGAWFLLEAHRLDAQVRTEPRSSGAP